MNTDTPETDEKSFEKWGHEHVFADFAQKLERQRDEARAEAQRLREALRNLFNDYKELADSGDAGHWKLEETDIGKATLEALEGPTVTTNHTSPTTEQAKIDMQASYDHMMSSKPSRRIMTAHGKEWWVHIPGDPMPCVRTLKVCVLTSLEGPTDPSRADHLGWHVRDEDEGYFWGKIIAWRPADAHDKLPREGGEG